LDAKSAKQVEQLQRAAQRGRAAEVDFSKVKSIDPVGAGLLLGVLVDFRSNARQLTLSGVEELRAAISCNIEKERRDPSDVCWLLKLETLRYLGQQENFEDLAIDYCVTYEVSPPSWEALPASIRLQLKAAAPTAENAAAGLDEPRAPLTPRADDAFALEGEIDGRPEATFQSLRDYAKSRAEVVIDCRRLRRMNFACAGEMLNETSALRSAGKSVIFRDLSFLVACMMMVMGIQDIAELNLRTR
jgi:anti-anti-sigma regulatory factor